MNVWKKIKRWFSKPKPVFKKSSQTGTVTLPNGRQAEVDEQGNFVRFVRR